MNLGVRGQAVTAASVSAMSNTGRVLRTLRTRRTFIHPAHVADALDGIEDTLDNGVLVLMGSLVGGGAACVSKDALCAALRKYPFKLDPALLSDLLSYAPPYLIDALSGLAHDSPLQKAVASLFPSYDLSTRATTVSILVERSCCTSVVLEHVNAHIRKLAALHNDSLYVSLSVFDTEAISVYRWCPVGDVAQLESWPISSFTPTSIRSTHTRLHEVPVVARTLAPASLRPNNSCSLRDVLGDEIRTIYAFCRNQSNVSGVSVYVYSNGIDTTSDRFSVSEVANMVSNAIEDGWRFTIAPCAPTAHKFAQQFGVKCANPVQSVY